jgi:hypothetical protein
MHELFAGFAAFAGFTGVKNFLTPRRPPLPFAIGHLPFRSLFNIQRFSFCFGSGTPQTMKNPPISKEFKVFKPTFLFLLSNFSFLRAQYAPLPFAIGHLTFQFSAFQLLLPCPLPQHATRNTSALCSLRSLRQNFMLPLDNEAH